MANPKLATTDYVDGYVNDYFANALKGTASGVSVRLDDVSPIEHTLGVKVSSKNLIPYPYPVQGSTINGITYTNNADGSVTAVGTATAASIYAPYTATANFELEPGTYTFSDDLADTSNVTYWSEVRGATDDKVFVHSYVTNRTFTITEKTKLRMNLRVAKGQTVNITFKPHLAKGTATTTFSSYISDLTKVTVTRYGKNFFDKNNANIIVGYIDANVIKEATTSRCIYIPCNPNTTYTVSKIATARFVVAFTNVIPTAGTAVTNRVQNYTATSITATSGADSKYIVVWLYNSAYDTTITIDEILATVQIELGSTATEYEPYKTPTEYTPAADGTVSGVKSLYPTTTLMTDTERVIIDAEYNRDINKAFAEMQQAILSMGGNV